MNALFFYLLCLPIIFGKSSYEMPVVKVKSKKNQENEMVYQSDVFDSNGFKTQSYRNLDQDQLKVYVDGASVQNGGPLLNLSILDELPSPKFGDDRFASDTLGVETKKGSGKYAHNVFSSYGKYNTYNEKISSQGNVDDTSFHVHCSANGQNGRKSVVTRLQNPNIDSSDKEDRQHYKLRLDQRTGRVLHTLFSRYHVGRYTYKSPPLTAFDLQNPSSYAKERFFLFRYVADLQHEKGSNLFSISKTSVNRFDGSEFSSFTSSDDTYSIAQDNSFNVTDNQTCYLNFSLLSERYQPEKDLYHQTFFEGKLGHKINIYSSTIESSINYQRFNDRTSHLGWCLRAEHQFYDQVLGFAKVGERYKKATLFQRYNFFIGNKNLKPEKMLFMETGYEYSKQFHFIYQSIFLNKITDHIDQGFYSYENSQKLKTYGLESGYVFKDDLWTFRIKYLLSFIYASKLTSLQRKPTHKAEASVTYNMTTNLSQTLSVDYIGRHKDRETYSTPLSKRPSITLFGIRTDYSISQNSKVFFNVKNLFNKHYEYPMGYRSDGFYAEIGLNVIF